MAAELTVRQEKSETARRKLVDASRELKKTLSTVSFFLFYSHITQLCGSLWLRGGAIAPSKSWLASFPKFSRTLDTLWSIDFQKNCAVNGRFSLPARRYASAGISHGPVSVCLCVCLSQVGVLVKWLDGSSWFLAWWLVLTCPTLYFKEIRVSTKIRVLSSGTFS